MKKLTTLALLLAAGALLGCQGGACGSCGELKANCCGWEFYQPCDLIEGKRIENAYDPCEQPTQPIEAPAPTEVPPAEAAPVEPAPPSEGPTASVDFPAAAPVADYGLPPAGR